jgi:hypothetical protein
MKLYIYIFIYMYKEAITFEHTLVGGFVISLDTLYGGDTLVICVV